MCPFVAFFDILKGFKNICKTQHGFDLLEAQKAERKNQGRGRVRGPHRKILQFCSCNILQIKERHLNCALALARDLFLAAANAFRSSGLMLKMAEAYWGAACFVEAGDAFGHGSTLAMFIVLRVSTQQH